MLTLNLSNLDSSDIKFKIINFPDGQQDIVVIPESVDDVTIKSRLNSFRDLELIICATKALRRLSFKNISLDIPYLLGSRSDRQFQVGGTSYLVDVIAPILNSLEFEKIYTTDVHSPSVTAACIKNIVLKNNVEFVKWALTKTDTSNIIISPDEGAGKKVYDLCQQINYSDQIVICSKMRNLQTGEIIKTHVPMETSDKNMVIIDDICDGGRTFIEIAKEIQKKSNKDISLIVTHGIFSKGFSELLTYFTTIYCTNSIRNISHSRVKQYKII